MKSGDLYRVVVPHLVAGVIAHDGQVAHAAPILGWSVGRSLDDLRAWVHRRKGTMEKLP